jgi:hypothetical protein
MNPTDKALDSAMPGPITQPLSGPGIPLLFGDENLERGESNVHSRTGNILFNGISLHLAVTHYRALWDMTLEYDPKLEFGFVSPDIMVVSLSRALAPDTWYYRIGCEGPAPAFVAEVLSYRMWQQADLSQKPKIYASLRIPEFLLVDVTGKYLPERLLFKRLQADGTYRDEPGERDGIISALGFGVCLEDGQVRVYDAATGKEYVRPDEAQQRIDALEAELARLRSNAK